MEVMMPRPAQPTPGSGPAGLRAIGVAKAAAAVSSSSTSSPSSRKVSRTVFCAASQQQACGSPSGRSRLPSPSFPSRPGLQPCSASWWICRFHLSRKWQLSHVGSVSCDGFCADLPRRIWRPNGRRRKRDLRATPGKTRSYSDQRGKLRGEGAGTLELRGGRPGLDNLVQQVLIALRERVRPTLRKRTTDIRNCDQSKKFYRSDCLRSRNAGTAARVSAAGAAGKNAHGREATTPQKRRPRSLTANGRRDVVQGSHASSPKNSPARRRRKAGDRDGVVAVSSSAQPVVGASTHAGQESSTQRVTLSGG